MHWPQIAYLCIMLFGLGVTAARDGQPDTYHFFSSFIATAVIVALLFVGGFFSH